MGGGSKKKLGAKVLGGGAGAGGGPGVAPSVVPPAGELLAGENFAPDLAGYKALEKSLEAIVKAHGGTAPPAAAAAATKVVSAWPEAALVGIAKKKGLKHAAVAGSGGGLTGGASPLLKAAASPAYPAGTAAIEEASGNAEHDFEELPPEVRAEAEEKERAAEEFVVAGVAPGGAAVAAPSVALDPAALVQKAREALKKGVANLKLGVSEFSQKAKGILDVLRFFEKVKEEVPRVAPEEFHALEFSFKRDASDLGGVHTKYIYADQKGREWLFKPDKHSGGVVAEAEAAASRVAKRVGQPALDVYVTETPHGKGSIQPFVKDAEKLGPDPTKYSPAQVRALVREHVVSWALSEHDAKHDNFIVTPGGAVVGVDKGQAFKYFGEDRLSLDYHPNKVHGAQEPAYYALYRAARAGKVKVNPYDALPVIEAFEKIPDDEYREMLRPVAEAAAKSPSKGQVAWWKRMEEFAARRLGRKPADGEVVEEFLRRACERKNNLRRDFARFFSEVLGLAVDFS